MGEHELAVVGWELGKEFFEVKVVFPKVFVDRYLDVEVDLLGVLVEEGKEILSEVFGD